MSQITLRGLPEPLEREIRKEARRRRSSLSKEIIQLLERAVGGVDHPSPKRRDLSSLAGTWDAAAFSEFEKAVLPFGEIEPETWRQ